MKSEERRAGEQIYAPNFNIYPFRILKSGFLPFFCAGCTRFCCFSGDFFYPRLYLQAIFGYGIIEAEMKNAFKKSKHQEKRKEDKK